MPPTIATAQYKKKDGSLTVADDRKYVFWTPATPPSSPPSVTVAVADVTNLQQTPATAKAIALKIVVKDTSYVFTFNHKENARSEQEAVTEVLRTTIANNKTNDAGQLAAPSSAPPSTLSSRPAGAGGENGRQSAAGPPAKADKDDTWYDDAKLKSDFDLQRSLLESNSALQERFNQSLKDKPETVSISQFTSQFWSARLHLLRAHAIEKAQKQGEYNVLPEIKFVRKPAEKEGEPDTKQLQITKQQIHLIFKQYPVVKEAYNQHVPPLSQGEFWTRFFGSRLLKKLKGEKISQHDPIDRILDRYLDREERGPASIAYIPQWMDLEGNEQNHSQRKGNRADQDMRPSGNEKVPILRVLNNLSEKMMAHVAPEDGEAHRPIGMDEETFEQLRLRDLANEDVDNRVKLTVKEQHQKRHAGGGDRDDDLSADAKLYAKQDPQRVLSSLQSDLEPSRLGSDQRGHLRLDQTIGYHTDEELDSDDDEAMPTDGMVPKKPKIGSHSAMTSASKSILSSITKRRHASSSDAASLNGLSQSVFDTLEITQNTTIEFLHYFWSLFLSGDASRASELAQLAATLDRSLDRINAVGAQAEVEREKKVASVKKQVQEYYQKTGKRRKVDYDAVVPGGKKVVEAMMQPTLQALVHAKAAFQGG